jgi:prepilin-type N-terminal cleavage/methylation domain-containing protein/prepilin-type processing-associated H-X9-DG protein
MRLRHRHGFTLVELLVVIAIIGILIGLLLPAVQMAREAARRSQCSNNLKQLMIAFHLHNDTKGGFPPCRVTTANQQHGWMVELLPFIEGSTMASAYNFNLNFFDVGNQGVVDQQLPVATCPSTPTGVREIPLGQGKTMYGTNGYAGDYFVTHLLKDKTAQAAGLDCYNIPTNPCKPVLFVQNNEENTIHPIRLITDGMSNTVLILEQCDRSNYWIGNNMQQDNSLLTNVNWWGAWASYQHFTYQGYNADASDLGTACAINCSNSQGIYSFHIQGSNIAYCDGSVRFVNQTIPIAQLMGMMTRDGAEPVSVPN